MRINIETIPHDQQRYETCGDYWIDDQGVWQIRVSKMSVPRSVLAVMIHELFEMSSVIENGIPISAIDDFDKAFEAKRQPGNEDEPGDDAESPYRREHQMATLVEMLFLQGVGFQWKMHEQIVNAL